MSEMPLRGETGRRLLILGWHNVEGTWSFASSPGSGVRGLRQQFTALSRFAHVVPLGWALDRLAAGDALPPRAVAITFDDGYADNLTMAVPVLERLALPATFFLAPDLLSGAARPWWEDLGCAVRSATATTIEWEGVSWSLADRASRTRAYKDLATRVQFRSRAARDLSLEDLLEQLRPFRPSPELLINWEGARELVRRGFDVQSHTTAHAVLSHESAEDQRRDLANAREQLERRLGVSITTVAYPHGTAAHYNASTLAAARDAGYRWGITTREGFSGPATPALELRRCVMYPERGLVELLAPLRYLARGA